MGTGMVSSLLVNVYSNGGTVFGKNQRILCMNTSRIPLAVLALVAGAVALTSNTSAATGTMLAPTPPMGWNSWDSFGPAVRENEVKANADAMAAKLARFGWQYVVVDIEWFQPNARSHGYIPRGAVTMDAYGRFVPSPNRFPSAANGAGFKPLADYVHSKGLKFGIHIMRGIPREAVDKNLPIKGTSYHAADVADKVNVCKWKGMEDTYGVDMTKPGAQAYYDSIAELYASWGVDFVKADDMSRPYQGPEVHALSVALKKTGRPIVLSLSPGPASVERYQDLKANAQMWRISDDFWDRWIDIHKQFDLMKVWEGKSHPGGWPDADMLPLGHIGIRAERGDDRASLLTHDEQYTLMSMWSIFRSPLMLGGDIPSSDAFTIDLLTNKEVLDVDQHSDNGREVYREGDIISWAADKPGSTSKYLTVSNTGDTEKDVHLPWKSVGINAGKVSARDLWTHKDLGSSDALVVSLRPHASVLLKVSMR
jgi:alpha-galactosidase